MIWLILWLVLVAGILGFVYVGNRKPTPRPGGRCVWCISPSKRRRRAAIRARLGLERSVK